MWVGGCVGVANEGVSPCGWVWVLPMRVCHHVGECVLPMRVCRHVGVWVGGCCQ